MGFAEQNLLNPQLRSLKGLNLAPESVSMLCAAKTIVLQACGTEGSFFDIGDLLYGWSLQCDKLREKDLYAGYKYALHSR